MDPIITMLDLYRYAYLLFFRSSNFLNGGCGLHQASKQTSILCVSTWWDTVLKLQSWSPTTAECHRNNHFVGREAQESSLPHRLTVSSASLHVWKKLTENISTLTQTTCVVLQWIPAHTSIRGNEIADQLAKERRKKQQPPSHLSYREVKTLIHNKKRAIFHSKTGGYKPNQDVSISCHDTNRQPFFASEQGTADWTAISRGLAWRPQLNAPVEKQRGPNTRTLPAILLILPPSKAADMAHLCVPQNQALGVYRGSVPDIQVCSTRERGSSQCNHHIKRRRVIKFPATQYSFQVVN